MSDAEGFLAAIRAEPKDDAIRLIYADWLDERGDPLGQFIRLQIELEPLRRPCPDPMAELERVRRLRKIPPGKEHPDDDWPLALRLKCEQNLLKEHKAEWLCGLDGLDDKQGTHFAPEFRRGFVVSAEIGLTALAEHGIQLRRACPVLQRFVVFGTLGRGEQLASCSGLQGLPELLLAGWLRPADATALADSPNLTNLRSLIVWIGAEGDAAMCRALTRLPALRELTLVQMWGGIEANEPEALDRRADELVASLRKKCPHWQVRLERPFTRRFPLDGVHIGYGIDAGHLPNGQAVLVNEGKQPVLIHFDDEGRMVHEGQLDLRDKLVNPPAYQWEGCDEKELLEVLGREIGFKPSPIFVREFSSELTDIGVQCWDIHTEELASPRTTDPEGEDIGASLYWWWSTSQFLLPFGNHYWADGLGRVHSS